jgi:hypothetical protein
MAVSRNLIELASIIWSKTLEMLNVSDYTHNGTMAFMIDM